MGAVAALEVAGLDLWFNSSDHRPPHFHAEKSGRWGVRVRFMRDPGEMIEIVWGEPRKAEVRALARLAAAKRFELLREWEAKVHVRDPGPER